MLGLRIAALLFPGRFAIYLALLLLATLVSLKVLLALLIGLGSCAGAGSAPGRHKLPSYAMPSWPVVALGVEIIYARLPRHPPWSA
jgi:hypothetical protein